MNEKVEKLIKQGECLEKQMRNEHLISLGLIDENKTERKYINESDYFSGCEFDTDENRYYYERYSALEVTEEEYEKICKYFSPISPEKTIAKTGAERTLDVIAVIVLACGIIGTIICLFSIAVYEEPVTGIITSIVVLLTSLATWAILRILCEIAINIRQINNKTE